MDFNTEPSTMDEGASLNDIQEENMSHGGLTINNQFKSWTEISRINYKSSMFLDAAKGRSSIKSLIQLPSLSYQEFICKNEEHDIIERFPVHVTRLMNEDQLWGCFYIFPELYMDEYSPTEEILRLCDVSDIIDGVLTKDMVAACLSYLRRTPILGDYVYIKLNLSDKLLVNIDVLEHYKFLVYLDLSNNLLTDLKVLSHLLYLQYLSVDCNRLSTVLDYETPQWFLTEVHYKFNSVKTIRNLTMLWSITIMDLSHNNITSIDGLKELHFLRRLDLSFNHIQRLENLDHLPLTWLDLSYNNISSFDLSDSTGLWTLLHLEYLNLDDNNLTTFKMFSGCTRLQELNMRNNRFSMLLELAIYMKQLRRLSILDLRVNPICSCRGYRDVVLNTFPRLFALDSEELDPIDYRNTKMSWKPDVRTFAIHRLQRLLYVEQLSKAQVSPYVPPADTTELPIVVLVGYDAIGKGALSRRLATECSDHVELGRQHTTACKRNPDSYIEVSREKFDDMLVNGEFLTYSELGGESYGLSREEAFVTDGKVKIVAMDLIGALMLSFRGRRPRLILMTYHNKFELFLRQCERAKKLSTEPIRSYDLRERSTLQMLLSERIIITGIINEIIEVLPDEKDKSAFLIPSGCSLLFDNSMRQVEDRQEAGERSIIGEHSGESGSEEGVKSRNKSKDDSLHSLYKESNVTVNDLSETEQPEPQCSQQESAVKKQKSVSQQPLNSNKMNKLSKSVDFSQYTSSTWKGATLGQGGQPSMKSSKSVTFTSSEMIESKNDPSGLLVEPQQKSEGFLPISVTAEFPWAQKLSKNTITSVSAEDSDLWLVFLVEAGLLQASDPFLQSISAFHHRRTTKDDDDDVPASSLKIEDIYNYQGSKQGNGTSIRDDYDSIHRNCPGLFWNVVVLDDPKQAFLKMKRILKDLVNNQKTLQPLFDIDFANLPNYPTVEKKLLSIRQQIAPTQLFH